MGQGGGTFFLNDEVVEVAPQSILLVKPGTALSWHLHAVLAGAAPYVYHACTAPEYAAWQQSGEQLWAQQQHLEKARHHLRLLLADVRQWNEAAPAAGLPPQVQQFPQLVETRLAGAVPALTLEPYAEARHLTPKHLSALCRQATGKSATDLLKEKIAAEAKVLLTGTPQPIRELGYRLGFYDVARFSRWFKLAVGQSPLAYRARFTGYE